MSAPSYRLGVDVGGTFTDVLLLREDTGETWRAKVPSTPDDQSHGVIDGKNQVLTNVPKGVKHSTARCQSRDYSRYECDTGTEGSQGCTRRDGRLQGYPTNKEVASTWRFGKLDHMAQA